MLFVFVGMPGVGKSSIGRYVASKLKIKLVDVDRLIEKRSGERLQSLLDKYGIDNFRRLEQEALLSIIPNENEHLIVSTGGSAIYSELGMEHLKRYGKIIYLYSSYEVIRERLGDFSGRGVVLKPGQDLLDLYNEREPLYKKYADITVSCNGWAFPLYRKRTLDEISKYIQT